MIDHMATTEASSPLIEYGRESPQRYKREMKLLMRRWVGVVLYVITLACIPAAAVIVVLSQRQFAEVYVAAGGRTYGIQIVDREVLFVIITDAAPNTIPTPSDPFGGTASYTRFSRDFRFARLWSGVLQNRAFCQNRVEFAVKAWLLVALLSIPAILFLSLATIRCARRWKCRLASGST